MTGLTSFGWMNLYSHQSSVDETKTLMCAHWSTMEVLLKHSLADGKLGEAYLVDGDYQSHWAHQGRTIRLPGLRNFGQHAQEQGAVLLDTLGWCYAQENQHNILNAKDPSFSVFHLGRPTCMKMQLRIRCSINLRPVGSCITGGFASPDHEVLEYYTGCN